MRVTIALPSLSIVLAVTLAACGAAPAQPDPTAEASLAAEQATAPTSSPTTLYYVGTVAIMSPDFATPYGPAWTSVASRTFQPDSNAIIEVVWVDGALRATTMTRRDDSDVFDVTDDVASFSGTVTFEGQPWAWSGWSYAITMADGSGRLEGTGAMTDEGFETKKSFVSAEGSVGILEQYRAVERAEFERVLGELEAAEQEAAGP